MARPVPPPLQPPAPPPDTSVTFAQFSGLRNLVSPENLTARDLARARNVDLDDAGQVHRRRGRRCVLLGSFHSIFTTQRPRQTFVVQDGSFVLLNPDYTTRLLVFGVGTSKLAYVQVGPVLYCTSETNSFKIDLPSLSVLPWGRVVSPSYQPHLVPGPADFWYSPIVNPTEDLGPITGRLFGAPPLGGHAAIYNGRIYVASGSTLWGTELYLHDYVDKTKGYRQYESKITGIAVMEDGYYVGTERALFFVSGDFGQEKRQIVIEAGVLPGSMIKVPGELVTPEARRFPDIPRQAQLGMSCMTERGLVVGLKNGETYNITETFYAFPDSVRASSFYRVQDGMHTIVNALDAGGSPATESARFGDYMEATIVRAGTPGQPGLNVLPAANPLTMATVKPGVTPAESGGIDTSPRTAAYDVEGNFLGNLEDN